MSASNIRGDGSNIRGDGPRAAQEIFQATLRLLSDHGYDGLTIEGVAEVSGVNKTTIYRWWPSKSALLAAAVERAKMLDIDIPDTGSLRGDLISVADQVLALLTGEHTRQALLAVYGAAGRESHLGDLFQRMLADRLRREAPIFERAVARGELTQGVDPMLLMDLIGGAIWMRVLFRQQAPGPTFAQRIVDTVLAGAVRK